MRHPALKPSAGNRSEEAERRLAQLEMRARGVAARDVRQGAMATTMLVAQTAHGFAVKDVVRHTGTSWTKSQANTPQNAAWRGVVVAVLGPDACVVWTAGVMGGLSGLTAGSVHFISSATAGALTTTAPEHMMPVLFALSTTEARLIDPRACVTVSTSDPGSTAANDGDVWFKY